MIRMTRHQITLYREFFADFSVNSQPILMEFSKDNFWVTRWLLWKFHQKILFSSIAKLYHLTFSKFVMTTSLYKPIKLVKLKFVFSPELYYMPDGLTF